MKRAFDWRVGVGIVGLATLFWMASSASSRALPTVAGRDLGPELNELEGRVSRDPGNRVALEALAREYLARGAPGLAEAALSRAPAAVSAEPALTDLRALALAELGHARLALDLQRSVLDACGRPDVACDPTLLGRAAHREAWLAQMVRLGVEDVHVEPERARLAHRLSTREVRLAVR